jgi:glyoxylase-like metal-dependent hydrolase (beta-lactamase superfamily II)/rhodanese-related sulfurtransferase
MTKVEQIYTGCLAHGAYFIVSGNEAAVIDPLRETEPYLQRAKDMGVTIKYVLETHFHADFVSGHIDLAKATGAKIVYGPDAKTALDVYVAKDGEELPLGNVKIKVIHTPGHTLESSCYLLQNENGEPEAIFTGDTLFIGDVGRPDLAQNDTIDQEGLASLLYDSLRNKIMPLPDSLIIYPGHGAGSACGKKMSNETVSTLGDQKKTNYALRADMTKEEFIKEVLDGLTPPPNYFPLNVKINKTGYREFNEVRSQGLNPLTPEVLETIVNETGAIILDTRPNLEFAAGFIPGAINIGLDGSFAVWVGTLIQDINQPIVYISSPGREEETVTRLARVGYDNVLGYLDGGMQAWKDSGRELDSIRVVDTPTAHQELQANADAVILDVRKPSEYADGHIKGAYNLPLDYLNQRMSEVPKDKTCYVHCAGGYRSMIFTSILKARGYNNLIEIKGGFNEIKTQNVFELTTESSTVNA